MMKAQHTAGEIFMPVSGKIFLQILQALNQSDSIGMGIKQGADDVKTVLLCLLPFILLPI